MATEAIIVRAVERGGDRQAMHEIIRRHSVATARAMKDAGTPNDLFARLAGDKEFGVPMEDIKAATDPARFVGRAPQQVDEFLAEVLEPLLAAHDTPAPHEDIRV
jgi:adenylosuccinate lyase